MNCPEKRNFRRLPITLDLSCRKVGSEEEQFHKGRTINVSPGGLYFETSENLFTQGDLLKVELSIPPTAGLLEFGGRISGFGKVLRTSCICVSGKYGTALEFCRPPKLCS
ncbi:MAG: PilZ domain-containing protein [Sedimentisphaerales bacterium]|nr:PilZ domain-containing protein [Sedimentisphaerales bacterium]